MALKLHKRATNKVFFFFRFNFYPSYSFSAHPLDQGSIKEWGQVEEHKGV